MYYSDVNFKSASAYLCMKKRNLEIERGIIVEKSELIKLQDTSLEFTLRNDDLVKYIQSVAVPNTVPHIFGCLIDGKQVIVCDSVFTNYNETVQKVLIIHELAHFASGHIDRYAQGDVDLQTYINDDYTADTIVINGVFRDNPILKNDVVSTLKFLKHSGFDVNNRIKNILKHKRG